VLHLRKLVTNDNGGTAEATDWTLTATGALQSPTNLSGPGVDNSSTDVQSGSNFKADTYTLAELVRHAGLWAGCPRPVWPMPQALAWCQARLMELAPGEPLMSRDNLASMKVDNVLTGSCAGLAELGLGRGMSLQGVFPARLP